MLGFGKKEKIAIPDHEIPTPPPHYAARPQEQVLVQQPAPVQQEPPQQLPEFKEAPPEPPMEVDLNIKAMNAIYNKVEDNQAYIKDLFQEVFDLKQEILNCKQVCLSVQQQVQKKARA